MRYRLHECGLVTILPEKKNIVVPPKEHGSKGKTYYIDWAIYRLIVSSAVKQYQNKVNNLVFLTLTFPNDISEEDANKCWSKYIDNLKLNYKLNSYVAVKELTERNRPHYHAIFDLPFQPIANLNRAWCATFPTYVNHSSNAARLPVGKNKAVVKDVVRITKYIGKYVSKARNTRYRARCYFISRNVRSSPRELTETEYREFYDTFNPRVKASEFFSIAYTPDVVFPDSDIYNAKLLKDAKIRRETSAKSSKGTKGTKQRGEQRSKVHQGFGIEPNCLFDSE